MSFDTKTLSTLLERRDFSTSRDSLKTEMLKLRLDPCIQKTYSVFCLLTSRCNMCSGEAAGPDAGRVHWTECRLGAIKQAREWSPAITAGC